MFAIQTHARTALLDLRKVRPAMAGAINRFARRIRRADAARRPAPQRPERLQLRRTWLRRAAPVPRRGRSRIVTVRPIATRLPSLSGRHPVPHRFALPRRLARRMPPTVLERQRRLAGHGGRPPFADSVERGAQRVADAIRARLLALRAGLLALRRRLAAGTRPRGRMGAW